MWGAFFFPAYVALIWATPARTMLDHWTALRFDPGRRP